MQSFIKCLVPQFVFRILKGIIQKIGLSFSDTYGESGVLESSRKYMYYNALYADLNYSEMSTCNMNTKLFEYALKVFNKIHGADPKMVWKFMYAFARLQFISPKVSTVSKT